MYTLEKKLNIVDVDDPNKSQNKAFYKYCSLVNILNYEQRWYLQNSLFYLKSH